MTNRPATSSRLLRKLNAAAVLRAIRSDGPISRAELARMTVYAEGRNRELAALTAPGARSLVEATRIDLTTFREQAHAGSYTL